MNTLAELQATCRAKHSPRTDAATVAKAIWSRAYLAKQRAEHVPNDERINAQRTALVWRDACDADVARFCEAWRRAVLLRKRAAFGVRR